MLAPLILIAILVAVGLPLYLLDRRQHPRDEEQEVVTPADPCTDDCCTTHDVCPSQQILAGLDKKAEYYDDEHLDRFAGRQPDDYTDDEIDEFRDVLYTLIATDRMPWYMSLKKRGIALPAPIHDEFVSLAGE